jgi:hypothetical protein
MIKANIAATWPVECWSCKYVDVRLFHFAAADFQTGIYLLIIGSHDLLFRNHYNRHANDWLNSAGCQAAGFLAMTAAEVREQLLPFCFNDCSW